MTSNEDMLEKCSIGQVNNSDCHKKSYTKNVGLVNIELFSQHDKELLIKRSGTNYDLVKNVCEHHKIYYLNKFEYYQKSCFDPFKIHKKKVTKSLRSVSLNLSEKINNIIVEEQAIPGFKICDPCREKVKKQICLLSENAQEEQFQNTDCGSESSVFELEKSISKEKNLEELNNSFVEIGESPFKFHAVPSHSKAIYAKRKIQSACSNMKVKVSRVLEKEISPIKEKNKEEIKKTEQKAQDMDRLINLIKEKLEITSTRREKIQLLTIVPISWSKRKVMEEFNVSQYSIRQARNLVKEKGILTMPLPRKGKLLSENTINLVQSIYQNDEYSRILPGRKDKVSISTNVYMQKRLLLQNLNELYSSFKLEHPEVKIGFSKFCMLRPKWCVIAGSAGTHSVCVCVIHQNVKLLLQASGIEETHKDLMKLLVCSIDSRDCMLGHCQKCPPRENLRKFLLDKFEEWDPQDDISYYSWVSTDRTQQVKFTVSMEEYLETVINSLETLIPHSFISKAQSKYLKTLKENIDFTKAIVLLDFSENYSYIIQDEVQGYHWTRDSCSVHPVVIYTRSDDSENLITSSLCVLSDDLEHDVAFVYETQKIVAKFLKHHFPSVNDVTYFSDGCAGQYKNCKNFFNLCNHSQDFNLTATWSFFATSHGKSPCDGIGGTVKRLVAKESLQTSLGSVIDSVDKVFSFCTAKIENINFWLLKKEILSETRQHLENRFKQAKTVPGTRSFHQFVPLSCVSVGTKRVSLDEDFTSIFNFTEVPSLRFSELCTNSYIACVYDDHWFFGTILSKHEEEGDIKVKFMHPFGPASSFYWPTREDICYVPLSSVIAKISTPITKGSGRVYYFSTKETQFVEHEYLHVFRKLCQSD